MPPDAGKSPSSSFEGDFAPGQVLIGRYRIVALLGEGGMGQVYLADDLVLGQPVALKFLPAHLAEHPGGLERFRAEVRLAREVTHPNVARVHDIGEVEGRQFLTMEFVDGEDLQSLIRRIGRLPREKAAEIAQQVCSGLAEAHRKGVLHRDLKPANVMLDGEGRVRLTDFGLAITADEDAPQAGTPQYMAPEQLSGLPATVRSEVYSLGLLLYELYTGQRALRGRTVDQLRREHEEGGPASASSHLSDLDPQVDAVLTRCLARDPKERPESVSEVARALPGGDALAAAIAAGETPAPHVVAAANTEEGLTPRTAAALLALTTLLFLLYALGGAWLRERSGVSYGRPPAFLRERARDLVAQLSGGREFAHEIHWLATSAGSGAAAEAAEGDGERASSPVRMLLHSRFSTAPLAPAGAVVTRTDPAPAPGSVHTVLDGEGRLLRWSLLPEADAHADADPVPADYGPILKAAGVPLNALEAVDPARLPGAFANERAAWRVRPEGGAPDEGLRVEAASLDGLPVELELLRGGAPLVEEGPQAVPTGMLYFHLAVLALATLLTWRAVRAGRADVRGSIAVGLFVLATHVVYVFAFPFPNDAAGVGAVLTNGISYALHTGVRVLLLYMALEPFARRRWPRALIAWSRLLEGRFRDPAVGRELLIGLLAATFVVCGGHATDLAVTLVRTGRLHLDVMPTLGLEGPERTLAHLVHVAGDGVMFAGTVTFVLVVLRSLIRISWLASAIWLSTFLLLFSQAMTIGRPLVVLVTLLVLLLRVGFLSAVAMMSVFLALLGLPVTLQPSEWYFSSSLVLLAALASLGVWSYRAAVAGRSLLAVPE